MLDNGSITQQGPYDCQESKNCADIPEPLTILGTVTAIGFGGFFKRKLNSTNQDPSKVV